MHGVDEAVLRIGLRGALADAQQRLGVAAVEGVQLAELAGQQVARPLGGHLLVDRQAPVGLAGHPGRRRLQPGAFAIVGIATVLRQHLGTGEEPLGAGLAVG